MERIQLINPERIEWCCADFGITPKELALEVSIAESSIERVLAGKLGFTFNQLRKIADFFGRGVLFFLDATPVDEAKVHTTQFRTLANKKPKITPQIKKLIENVEGQRETYLGLLEDLDEIEKYRFNPPEIKGLALHDAANVVREWLDLGKVRDFDAYRNALQLKGILVFKSNGYEGKWQIAKDNPILGFSLYDDECPVVFVKKQALEARQTFTLIHELGHLLLHKMSSIDDENDLNSYQGMEHEASAFAGLLLVPDHELDYIDDSIRPESVSLYDKWLASHCKHLGVSCEVILRRLYDNNRLLKSEYNAYREWLKTLAFNEKDGGNRKYRHREPIHIFGDVYVRAVLDALSSRQITITRASDYLDRLKIKDLHKLGEYYANL